MYYVAMALYSGSSEVRNSAVISQTHPSCYFVAVDFIKSLKISWGM